MKKTKIMTNTHDILINKRRFLNNAKDNSLKQSKGILQILNYSKFLQLLVIIS